MNKITKTILFSLLVLISFTLIACNNKVEMCDEKDEEVIKNTIRYPQNINIGYFQYGTTIYDITLSESYYVVCLYSNFTKNSILKYVMTMCKNNTEDYYDLVKYKSLNDVKEKYNKMSLNEVWLVYEAKVKDVFSLEESNERYYKDFTVEYASGKRSYNLSFNRFLFQIDKDNLNGKNARLMSYNISCFKEIRVIDNKECVLFSKSSKYPNGRIVEEIDRYFSDNYYDVYKDLIISNEGNIHYIHNAKYDIEVENIAIEYNTFIQKTKEVFNIN